MSKNVSLVKWILRHVKEQKDKRTSSWKFDGWVDSLNLQYETPFTLAIRTGNQSMIHNIGKLHPDYLISHIIRWDFSTCKRFDLEEIWQPICDHRLTMRELKDHIVQWRENTEEDNEFFINHVNRSLALLDARGAANDVIREAVDAIFRRLHLGIIEHFTYSNHNNHTGVALKENFGGILAPWWDPNLSSFDIEDYIANRTEKDLFSMFHLLGSAIQSGCMDDALWLLDYFKAPPSLMSIKGTDHYDMDWYVGHSAKLTQKAIEGWVAQRAIEFRGEDKVKPYFSHHDVHGIVIGMLGSSDRDSGMRNDNDLLLRMQWVQMFQGKDGSWDMQRTWQALQNSMPEADTFGDLYYQALYGVSPKNYAAVKRACSLPLEDFESSDQVRLLNFFLRTTYKHDPNFLSVDLPNLSQFVILDHLPLFQFLTKRDGQERPFLDLGMPLFCPDATEFDEAMEDTEVEDDVDPCCICLGFMKNPYCLECGHNFHHQCFFHYAFPDAREAQEDGQVGGAHKVLAGYPHLSFELGFTSCPYCRQSVKPSLPEAFALNLADGLRRTKSERLKQPCSPHLDLRVNSVGITVGETLLAFSACAGAIGIFQWLVRECNIDPKSVSAGGVNIMHHAIAHKQVLIVRWLLEFGYGDMLFGGMEGDSFDRLIPLLTPGNTLEDFSALLEDGPSIKRLKVLKQIIKLRSCTDGDELTAAEQEVLDIPTTNNEREIIKCGLKIERMSPMHYLLMNGLRNFDDSIGNNFFRLLRSKGISAIPTNWYLLSLAFSLDTTMRSDAKAFVSKKILSIPARIKDKSFEEVLTVSTCSNWEDVLVTSTIDYLSPISIAMNAKYYNLWEMLLRGEIDWRLFLRVANACNAWIRWATFDWFQDADDNEAFERIKTFIEAVIYSARVDIIAAFTKMESFCHPDSDYGHSSLFDLFSETQSSSPYAPITIALRPIAVALEKMDAFLPFFQHVDLVKKAVHDSHLANHKIAKDILAGVPIEEVLDYVESQKNIVQSLPEVEPPLGVGSHDEVLARFDLSRTDWLSHSCYIEKEHVNFFDKIVEKRDTSAYWWTLSHYMMHVQNLNVDKSGAVFVRQVIKKIVETGDIFALEEFISFCAGSEGPIQYQQQKHLVMADLLNIEGVAIRVRYTWGESSEGAGGILGDVISRMLVVRSMFVFHFDRHDSITVASTIAKIESLFRLAEFFLSQPDVATILLAKEAREKVLTNIFGGATDDVDRYASGSPHVIFRVLVWLRSKGFNLASKVGDKNLRLLLL